MSDALLTWWLALCAASLVNAGAWAWSAGALRQRAADFPADVYDTRRALLWLSAVYVLGCGFRSFLPMIDVPRICLHDTWVSRIVVGRTVATVAEVCFAMQWALLLREAGAAVNHRFTTRIAGVIVPLIVIAEVASWHAVLSTNYLSHALENSLWTVAALLGVAGCAGLRFHTDGRSRRFLDSAIVFGVAYVLFMVIVDVPMYVSRWLADGATDHNNLSLLTGFEQIAQRCTVMRDWAVWREDVPWLSLYFTMAVWASIALAHTPVFKSGGRQQAGASEVARP